MTMTAVTTTSNSASTASSATGERVLVVDDEADIVALVAYHLVKAGYRVSTASSGPDALSAARQERPALIVLDLMLPGASGYEVLEQLRAHPATRDTAVLMLTARREEPDRIRGLSLGADDYLTKPFSPQELVLRVGAILRRITAGGAGPSDVLTIGTIVIDRDEHRVTVQGRHIDLTPTEYKLLRYMMLNARRALSKAQILDHVWEYDFDGDANVVETYISYLRKKIDKLGPPLIHTIRGVGYTLRTPPED